MLFTGQLFIQRVLVITNEAIFTVKFDLMEHTILI